MYTVFSGKQNIEGDELFFGIINYMHTQPHASIFFDLVGLKRIDAILEHANKLYLPMQNFQENKQVTMQLQLTGLIQTQVIEQKITETDNIIWLFAIACNSLTKQTLARWVKSKIGLIKMIKSMPMISTRIESIGLSTKELFKLLKILQQNYGISILELSKMDTTQLQVLANEIWSQTSIDLQNVASQTINDQLVLLINKLMETLHTVMIDKWVSNKRINPLFNNGDIDEDMMDSEGKENTSFIETKEGKEADNQKKLTIDYFWTDLTKQASDNELDPVIGREREIDQIIYTLLRKTKNSPLLIGEAGVGKTAIIEWLAQRIANNQIPDKLKGHRVINLDITAMVAGTKYRGEFEQRLKSILDEASDPLNQIIVFIDELHAIIGAGGHDGGDMANSIKPMLSRGKIKLIGATTFDEYQKHIEKDAALKRRFQEIHVDEPKPLESIAILKGLKERFEQFHDVNISDKAIEHAVGLSVRYIMNKHLPDKAIDLLDEAAARKSVLLSKLENNDEYSEILDSLKIIENKIQAAVSEQDYFKAAELKQEELTLKNKVKNLKTKSTMPAHLRPTVDEQDIGKVLSDKLGIPTDIINESEIHKLVNLQDVFDTHIFGQQEAVEKVVKAIQKSRLSIIPKNKPIASYLFLGPSWVGKTYIAKLIAEHYFHDPKALIRIDMSEYMEKYSVSKIIWSAPGYVGYDDSGSLTELVRRKPHSVLLFDEIEKADKSVLNILLQILDEGTLKDSKGRVIDFKNTIIVMTSNIGSEYFSQTGKQIGFNYKHDAKGDDFEYESIKTLVLDKVNDYLSPELLNRIDHKVVFAPLGYEQLEKVFTKLYNSFKEQRKWNPSAIVPDFTKEEIRAKVEELYSPQYGARPIEQYIYNELEDKVIHSLLTQV
jgi:ATP-dependent Clp protease ATP-binding subunit ClpC